MESAAVTFMPSTTIYELRADYHYVYGGQNAAKGS